MKTFLTLSNVKNGAEHFSNCNMGSKMTRSGSFWPFLAVSDFQGCLEAHFEAFRAVIAIILQTRNTYVILSCVKNVPKQLSF